MTIHVKSFELRCLADAGEDRYSALFKDVDVGTGWRSRVTFEMQGPIDLTSLYWQM